ALPFRFEELYTVTHYFSYKYSLTVLIVISAALQSSVNTRKTSFFQILADVFRLLAEYNTVYEVGTAFAVRTRERAVKLHRISCYGTVVLYTFMLGYLFVI